MPNHTGRRIRRTTQLQKGRTSVPHARYFVTCSAVRPTNALHHSRAAHTLITAIDGLSHAGDIVPYAYTVMPDHLHLLFALGDRLTLPQIVGKLKAQTRAVLREYGTAWQANFYEHRLRPDETMNDYARYIFLNPYRAGITSPTEDWPYTFLCGCDRFDFQSLLIDGRHPPQEWLLEKIELPVGND